jgi:hypothetical protein
MDLQRIASELNEWRGGLATLWSYSVSHQRLEIRFTREGKAGNLHIVCGDCTAIAAPVRWKHERLLIRQSVGTAEVELDDDTSGVKIRCGALQTLRDASPVHP